MGLYRRGKTYWFTISHDGGRIQESTGTGNKKLAERIYAKSFQEIQEGRWFERKDELRPFGEMLERFTKELSMKGIGMQVARAKSIVKHLEAFFGKDVTLRDMGRRIGEYEFHRLSQTTKRGKAPDSGTIRRELCLLRRMFNIAQKQWKWNASNPVSTIELPRESKGRVRYLSPDELGRLFEALECVSDGWLKPFVFMALDTGLRLNNLCGLTWKEVDLPSRCIFIDSGKMKNNEYHATPLTARAVMVLEELRKVRSLSNHVFHDKGHPLQDRKVQRAFIRALDRANIEDFRFHDLRHTYASYLRQNGVALDLISKLLGHKDLRMTERYAHLSLDPLKEAVKALENPVYRGEVDGICYKSATVGKKKGATQCVTP